MRNETVANVPTLEVSAGHSRLLSRIYRDIGLAAVAIELDLLEDDLGEEMEDAIERGARSMAPRQLPLAS
ncbi:MAG: hypothetical protein ACLPN5_04985 [Roseiarcus sp.]